MNQNMSRFTVLFQPPFWVGIAERWDETGYQAAEVTFGPEPTDAQLYEWLEKEWHRLRFSSVVEGEYPAAERKNPKRAQREARTAARQQGISTRAQEALSRQREQDGAMRRALSRQAHREGSERKYLLHQQKKREKKRGR